MARGKQNHLTSSDGVFRESRANRGARGEYDRREKRPNSFTCHNSRQWSEGIGRQRVVCDGAARARITEMTGSLITVPSYPLHISFWIVNTRGIARYISSRVAFKVPASGWAQL
jgi:hypothetical protein